ncbi:MAG: hypothetical protein ACI9XO_002128 [Paraglaciecola sp.]|jgi:hypothetical protein
MTSSEINIPKFSAKEVWFDNQKLHIKLIDNREIAVPIDCLPSLAKTTQQ